MKAIALIMILLFPLTAIAADPFDSSFNSITYEDGEHVLTINNIIIDETAYRGMWRLNLTSAGWDLIDAGLFTDGTRSGLLVCKGYHADPTGNGLMSTSASFALNNYNDDATITIDRIIVYDSSGNSLCDYPTDPWTETWTFKNVLEPNGLTWFSTDRMAVWCPGWPTPTWASLKIYWSSSDTGRIIPLHGTTTQVTRHLDTGLMLTRSDSECIPLE